VQPDFLGRRAAAASVLRAARAANDPRPARAASSGTNDRDRAAVGARQGETSGAGPRNRSALSRCSISA